MIPVCASNKIKKYKNYKSLDGNILLTRDSQNNLRWLPRTCNHMAFDLAEGKQTSSSTNVLCQICPYHGRKFEYLYVNSQSLSEIGGVIFYDNCSPNEKWGEYMQEVNSNNWRSFKVKGYYKHLLANLVDYEHFGQLHKKVGGVGLSLPNYEEGKTRDSLSITWTSQFSARPAESEVELFKEEFTVVSKVPFLRNAGRLVNLISVNIVVPSFNEEKCTLLTNFYFDEYFYNTSPVIRFWANRIVDILVWEDKWVLENLRIGKNTPSLEHENNPLILSIYK